MVHDIDAAKKAGVKIAAICWGYQPREVLEAENPDYLINDLQELATII